MICLRVCVFLKALLRALQYSRQLVVAVLFLSNLSSNFA